MPFFAGRDVRGLETMIDEIYAYKWNYKYAGSAFWMPVAWAEAAVLDLLGKAAGKSIGDLLGGRKRDQVLVYVSSLIRVVDILQPDMLYNGGFIRNHRANVIARHYGLPLTPHSPYLGPRQALSTHFCATLPELPIELEFAAALPERPMDW